MTDTKVIATVDVASAWGSKINWTQAVSGFAMVLTFATGGKLGMTIDQQAAVVTTIGVFTNIATWVMKTWFTKTITPASAAAPEVPTATVSAAPTPVSLVSKASAIVAILILGNFLLPGHSYAQTPTPRPRAPLAITGNPIKDIQTDLSNQGIQVPAVTPGSTGCDFNIFSALVPSNVVAQIQNCVSDVNKQFLPDVQAAFDSATAAKDQPGMACLGPALNIVKAAIGVPAVAAVEAQPNATPPVAAVAAVPGTQPGVILIFQKFREFVLAGGPAACKTWATSTVSGATAGTL
jgi:hypothetical protein